MMKSSLVSLVGLLIGGVISGAVCADEVSRPNAFRFGGGAEVRTDSRHTISGLIQISYSGRQATPVIRTVRVTGRGYANLVTGEWNGLRLEIVPVTFATTSEESRISAEIAQLALSRDLSLGREFNATVTPISARFVIGNDTELDSGPVPPSSVSRGFFAATIRALEFGHMSYALRSQASAEPYRVNAFSLFLAGIETELGLQRAITDQLRLRVSFLNIRGDVGPLVAQGSLSARVGASWRNWFEMNLEGGTQAAANTSSSAAIAPYSAIENYGFLRFTINVRTN